MENPPQLARRIPWRTLLKVAVSALLLAFLFHSIDREAFLAAFLSLDPRPLALAVVFHLFGQAFFGLRWYFILRKMGEETTLSGVLKHTAIYKIGNLFLPGITGDALRLVPLGGEGIAKSSLFFSVIIDKFSMLSVVAAFVLLGLGGPLGSIPLLLPFAIIVAACSLLPLLILSDYGSGLRRLLLRLVPRSFAKRLRMSQAESVPHLSIQDMAGTLFLALLQQSAACFMSFFLAHSFSIRVPIAEWASVNALTSLAQTLPVTIGGLGIREGTYALLLRLYGIPAGQTLSFSLFAFSLMVILTGTFWSVVMHVLAWRRHR